MKKILIIEDEISLSSSLKAALTSAGFQVEQAFDGAEGLTKALGTKFDAILLDLLMPVKDGFDFLHDYIHKDAKPAPIIVLSNLSDFGSQMKTFERGTVSYMVKANVSLEDIVKKITSIVE